MKWRTLSLTVLAGRYRGGEIEMTKANDYRRKHSRLHGALVLSCLVFFGIGVLPKFGFCAVVLFVLMLSGLYLGFADVFAVGLTCGLMSFLCRVARISSLWPLPMVLAVSAMLIAGKLLPFTRGAFGWIKRGNWGRQEIAITAVVAAISGISLAWIPTLVF